MMEETRTTTAIPPPARLLTRDEVLEPNLARLIASRISELPPVERRAGNSLLDLPVSSLRGKRTHRTTERKVSLRSFRFSHTADRMLMKIARRLRVDNVTTVVEACIIATAVRLGIDN